MTQAARPAIRCRWMRTRHRKSNASSDVRRSRGVNSSSITVAPSRLSGARDRAIQYRVFRSRKPPFPSLTLGSTL